MCNKILEILFIFFFLLLSVVGLSLFFSLRVVSLFNRSPSEAPFYCRGISNESLMVWRFFLLLCCFVWSIGVVLVIEVSSSSRSAYKSGKKNIWQSMNSIDTRRVGRDSFFFLNKERKKKKKRESHCFVVYVEITGVVWVVVRQYNHKVPSSSSSFLFGFAFISPRRASFAYRTSKEKRRCERWRGKRKEKKNHLFV